MPVPEHPFPEVPIGEGDLRENILHLNDTTIRCLSFADAMEVSARWPDISVLGAPLWAEVWPAEHDLVHWACQHPEYVTGKQILELGCGTGFAACVITALGATVTATDAEPNALVLTRFNAERNGLILNASLLDWTLPESWPDQTYDILTGADIVYDPELHTAIWNLVRTLLRPGGRFILADPDRREAAAFRAKATSGTWTRDGRVWVWEQ